MEKDILTSTFTRLHSRLLSMARHMLPPADDANDALQEAFYRLWKHRRAITTPRQAEGLSVTTVRNICIDTIRRQHPVADISDTVTDIPDTSEDTENRSQLLDQVRHIIDTTLTERQREILYMRDLRQMPIDEIAEVTALSQANIRLILSRARRSVRENYLKSKQQCPATTTK